MENRAHALAAGLFLVLMGLALVATISWFQGDHSERVRYTIVSTGAVTGLNVKAAVKLRGVDVGKVEAIAFDPQDSTRILVSAMLDKAAPITRGTYAQLAFQGVTGLQFIALDDSGTDRTPLLPVDGQAPPRLELRPTLLDGLAAAAPALVAGASDGVRRVNTLLSDGNRAHVDHALTQLDLDLDQVSRILAAVRPAAAAMPALVSHADAVALRAGEVLDKVDVAVGRVDSVAARIDGLAAEASGLAADLRARAPVIDQFGLTARQIETSTRNLERAIAGAEPGRTPALLEQAAGAGRSLRQAAQDLDEQPQSLVFGRAPLPPGPGESGFDARLRGKP